MKAKNIALLLAAAFGLTGLVACGGEHGGSESTSSTSVYTGDYRVTVQAIGSTTITVSNTVQLRSSVTGTTEKDVIWSSSDEEIASVSNRGLVTGLKEGEVTITASLAIEPACKASINVTVLGAPSATSVTISGADERQQWVGEDLQLGVEVLPEDASSLVDWSSSNQEVATVDATGLVSFLSEGEVTITAKSKDTPTVLDEATFTVSEGVFYSNQGSPYWDISKQADASDPNVELPADTPTGYHSLYFSHVKSENYYVEARFNITAITSSWVWQGIGLGSGLSESDTRYFIFSPRVDGQGNDYNKQIVKDLPNESWPAITTRSQVWGQNGLNEIDYLNSEVKIGMLRHGNEHYWLINDKVMWYDNSTKYEGIPTMPILVSVDIPCVVTGYSVSTDMALIEEKLSSPAYAKSFYASNPEIVRYEDDSSFSFISNSVLCKDNKVSSLGDKAMLLGDFTIELDVSNAVLNPAHTAGFTGLNIGLSRYDSADSVESFLIGKSAVQPDNQNIVARFASWNYQLSMDDPMAATSYLESSGKVADELTGTHHIKITRTIEDNISYFKMYVDGNEVNFDVKSNQYVEMTSRYTGSYLLWVGGEYTSADIANLEFTSSLN